MMAPFLKRWRKARRQRKKYFKRLTSITQFAPEDVSIVGYPKSGNTWFLCPRPKFRRVVYLMRDGRDVMVSLYHYEKAMGRSIDLGELVRKGHPSHGKWHAHINDWLANPHGAEMIVMRYEDLKQNAAKEMQRFCSFAGIKRDISFVETMVRETEFEKMQQRELRSGSGMRAFPTDKLLRRRGIAGRPALAEEFMAHAGETLRRCGYE